MIHEPQSSKEQKCAERVWDTSTGWGKFRPCARAATKDGFCGIHHPDAKKARDERSRASHEAKAARSPYAVMAKMQETINAQQARITELESACHAAPEPMVSISLRAAITLRNGFPVRGLESHAAYQELESAIASTHSQSEEGK
jgi:hypothetical protein